MKHRNDWLECALLPCEKEAARNHERPKSREETPKVGNGCIGMTNAPANFV